MFKTASAKKIASLYLKFSGVMPRIQYHSTPWVKIPSLLRKGLQLPRGPQDVSTLIHDIPSISTADSPENAKIYYPHGALLKILVNPGAKYLARSPRGMRRGEILIDSVNRWSRETLEKGADGFYMDGWQSTVGNQTLNPKVLKIIEILNPDEAPPNIRILLRDSRS